MMPTSEMLIASDQLRVVSSNDPSDSRIATTLMITPAAMNSAATVANHLSMAGRLSLLTAAFHPFLPLRS